ncbi:isochorismatase family protein [Paraburkholderia sp. CNPSo 3274]|uniref:isochorismatase family protein n=1 Tax=Paraburkholderia sp. CNPSo 3274 TaxID=2940932 RepID=UPI0020B79B05|nr:isochorismatase family protein [Paraburkholderia sp. CNPSo 3274]MCP3712812.1 isochorismatase family protein [Paraburkholderia sp. CNPSo 3274]
MNAMMRELIPSSTQFLFVDLQPKIMASSRTLAPDILAAAAGVLAEGADLLGCPMTFAFAPEGPGREPVSVPELVQYARSDVSFTRTVTGPFLDSRIAHHINGNERRTLVVAGYTVEVAVIQSVIGARAAGFDVFVPVDGTASRSKRTEMASIREIEILGGVVTSVRSLLMRLAPDLGTPTGRKMLEIVSKLREAERD